MEKRRGPSPLKEAIRGFLREHRLSERSQGNEVLTAWDGVLDPELRQHACAVRFQRGTLTVEVDSTVLLHDLKTFSGEAYRKKANDSLGATQIKKVAYKLRG